MTFLAAYPKFYYHVLSPNINPSLFIIPQSPAQVSWESPSYPQVQGGWTGIRIITFLLSVIGSEVGMRSGSGQ